jgi:predicted small secreted protein
MSNDHRAVIAHRLVALVLLLLPIALAACNQNGGSGY